MPCCCSAFQQHQQHYYTHKQTKRTNVHALHGTHTINNNKPTNIHTHSLNDTWILKQSSEKFKNHTQNNENTTHAFQHAATLTYVYVSVRVCECVCTFRSLNIFRGSFWCSMRRAYDCTLYTRRQVYSIWRPFECRPVLSRCECILTYTMFLYETKLDGQCVRVREGLQRVTENWRKCECSIRHKH